LSWQQFIAVILALTLVAPFGAAQTGGAAPPAAGTPAPQPAEKLVILVLEGDRAINNARSGQVTPPVVEVHDANGRPVAGATVIFELPETGPGGTFAGNARTQTTTTNHQGQATVTGYAPNGQLGRFNIRVTARAGAAAGDAVIAQMNSPNQFSQEQAVRRPAIRKKWWLVVGLAAGAGAGLAIGLRNRSSSKDVVLSPGGITVGAPH
jgi:hypothetical protein